MLQLTLNIQPHEGLCFENFYLTPENATVLHSLQHFFEKPEHLYLWSLPEQGRTHLLQGLCHLAKASGKRAMYLSLKRKTEFEVGILQNLESYDVVCMDDIEAIIGWPLWEEALFHLYNQLEAAKKYLVVTAAAPPSQLNCMPDLQSRLSASTVFHLHPLTDPQKLKALQNRSLNRGLCLSPSAGKFLLHHFKRDNVSLFQALDQLDAASLIEKQALTIPFIKKTLSL